jgi:hypothetical protein
MLRHLESCIASLWQGLEFSRRALDTKLFEKGDGSVYERLNWLYNVGRHSIGRRLLHVTCIVPG